MSPPGIVYAKPQQGGETSPRTAATRSPTAKKGKEFYSHWEHTSMEIKAKGEWNISYLQSKKMPSFLRGRPQVLDKMLGGGGVCVWGGVVSTGSCSPHPQPTWNLLHQDLTASLFVPKSAFPQSCGRFGWGALAKQRIKMAGLAENEEEASPLYALRGRSLAAWSLSGVCCSWVAFRRNLCKDGVEQRNISGVLLTERSNQEGGGTIFKATGGGSRHPKCL